MVQTILRRDDVVRVTGLCQSQIYRQIQAGKFPKPIRLSSQSVGWLENEIAAWQRARIAERDGLRAPIETEAAA